MVGAGVGGRGAPPAPVAVGGPPEEVNLPVGALAAEVKRPVGGPAEEVKRPVGANETVADGTAGGVSTPCKLTRIVSFLRGTLDVSLDGAVDSFSLSLISCGFYNLRG